jgi:hypothetical protein
MAAYLSVVYRGKDLHPAVYEFVWWNGAKRSILGLTKPVKIAALNVPNFRFWLQRYENFDEAQLRRELGDCGRLTYDYQISNGHRAFHRNHAHKSLRAGAGIVFRLRWQATPRICPHTFIRARSTFISSFPQIFMSKIDLLSPNCCPLKFWSHLVHTSTQGISAYRILSNAFLAQRHTL